MKNKLLTIEMLKDFYLFGFYLILVGVVDCEVRKYGQNWEDEKRQLGLNYSPGAKEALHYMQFEKNMDNFEAWNQKNAGYKLGPNKFAHHNITYLRQQLLIPSIDVHVAAAIVPAAYRPARTTRKTTTTTKPVAYKQTTTKKTTTTKTTTKSTTKPTTTTPKTTTSKIVKTNVDWSSNLGPVKDQGFCGSCYAFATVAVLEALSSIKYGQSKTYSEQQFLDCTSNEIYGNWGCEGGLVDSNFKYATVNGISESVNYPYLSYDAQDFECHNFSLPTGTDTLIKVSSFSQAPPGNEIALLDYVRISPVTAYIDASTYNFMFYSNGIFYDPQCSKDSVNHAVAIVGFGTDENGMEYWKIRNSWGNTWGENGYMRLARNKANNCMISSYVFSAKLA